MASLIKREIQKCKGISTRPLDIRDISAHSSRRLIPDCLYLLLKLLITNNDSSIPSEQCTRIEDERQVLSLAQDIIHCCTNGRVKLPKHTSLTMCIHHLTSSKQLIALLNRMGHCASYDEMHAVNTSIALEVIAKANQHGTVIPSNIAPGPFVQIAADNNDLNEETIDGKNTTHATTMVIYQKKPFGPDPPPYVLPNKLDGDDLSKHRLPFISSKTALQEEDVQQLPSTLLTRIGTRVNATKCAKLSMLMKSGLYFVYAPGVWGRFRSLVCSRSNPSQVGAALTPFYFQICP